MTRTTTSLVVLVAATAFAQQQAPGRPKITGIDHVAFYTTDPVANARLYNTVLGIPPTIFPTEPGQSQGFQIGRQSVVYTPAPDQKSNDRMDHVAFRTDDCEARRPGGHDGAGVRFVDAADREPRDAQHVARGTDELEPAR